MNAYQSNCGLTIHSNFLFWSCLNGWPPFKNFDTYCPEYKINHLHTADVADCWGNLARYVATGARGLQYPLSIRSFTFKSSENLKSGWATRKREPINDLSWNGHLVSNSQIRCEIMKIVDHWNPVQSDTVRSSIGCAIVSVNSWMCMLDRTSFLLGKVCSFPITMAAESAVRY